MRLDIVILMEMFCNNKYIKQMYTIKQLIHLVVVVTLSYPPLPFQPTWAGLLRPHGGEDVVIEHSIGLTLSA